MDLQILKPADNNKKYAPTLQAYGRVSVKQLLSVRFGSVPILIVLCGKQLIVGSYD
jgi:hypothetical protein